MNVFRVFLFVIMTMLVISVSFSADVANPSSGALNSSQSNFKTCRLLYEAQAMLIRVGGKVTDPGVDSCISDFKEKAKPKFKLAVAQFENNKAAQSILKDYYAFWVSAMDGINPSFGEREMAYSNRQAEAERKLNELRSRFEIEVGM